MVKSVGTAGLAPGRRGLLAPSQFKDIMSQLTADIAGKKNNIHRLATEKARLSEERLNRALLEIANISMISSSKIR